MVPAVLARRAKAATLAACSDVRNDRLWRLTGRAGDVFDGIVTGAHGSSIYVDHKAPLSWIEQDRGAATWNR